MVLKQLNNIRIVFLEKFVQELIVNSAQEILVANKIEIEKLRQKFTPHPILPNQNFQTASQTAILPPIQYPKPQPAPQMRQKPTKQPLGFERTLIPQKIKPLPRNNSQEENIQRIQRILKSQQQSPPIFSGHALAKLQSLIQDPMVLSIECPGPEKNILVRTYKKLNITRFILTDSEIDKIINYFSEQARIPVIGGILKAAVENLIISAVKSDYVGSRFIINKMTPYSLIEEKK